MYFFMLQGVSYAHADGTTLFSDISLKLTPRRYGLIASNGSGKTTLFSLLRIARAYIENSDCLFQVGGL